MKNEYLYTAFISSVCDNCHKFWVGDDDEYFGDYIHTYLRNVLTAATSEHSDCMIFFGLGLLTNEENLDLDEARLFINVLTYDIEED